MKTNVTAAQLAAFDKRTHELHRRIMEGTLPIERVIYSLQDLIEGKFVPTAEPATFADMIAAGRYDWVNHHITEENFPVNLEHFTAEGLQVIHYGKAMKTQDILADFDKRNLRVAAIEELLAYGAAHPEEQRKHAIAGLGSSWVNPKGDRYVPYLNGHDRCRDLDLRFCDDDPEDQWYGHCRFLVFCK